MLRCTFTEKTNMIPRYVKILLLFIPIIFICISFNLAQNPIPSDYLSQEDEKKLEEIAGLKLKADEYKEEAEEIYKEISKLKSEEGLTNQSEKIEKLRVKALKKDILAFEKLKERNNQTYQLYKAHLEKFKKDSSSGSMESIKAKLLQEDAKEFFYRASSMRNEAYNQTQDLEEKFEKLEKANNIEKLGLEKVEEALSFYYEGAKKDEKSGEPPTSEEEKYNLRSDDGNGKVVINRELLRNIKQTLERVDTKDYLHEFYRLKVEDTISSDKLRNLWVDYLYQDQKPSSGQVVEKEEEDTSRREKSDELIAEESRRKEKDEYADKERPDTEKKTEVTREEIQPTAKDQMRGMVFRVQIAADKKPLSQGTLRKLYSGGKKEITRVVENGWYKYSIGDFSTFKQANQFRADLNVNDAFIVAYKDGEKLSPGQMQRVLTGKEEKADTYEKETKQAKESSIVFQVQIAASKESIPRKTIHYIYSGPLSVNHHQVEGWNKYAIGEYDNYEDANELKKRVDVDGAFVTAYRGDELLKIKEAIRLSQGGYKKPSWKDQTHVSAREMTFKVQIAADRIQIPERKLNTIYSGSKTIQLNQEEGWYRYSVCNCPSYHHALQVQKNLGVKGAFVVSYKEGKRYNAYRFRRYMECPDIEIQREITPKQSVVFKVQIAASSYRLSKNGLRYIYCGRKDVVEYEEGGWFKYAVGNFSDYQEASDLKREICVPGAFVVAFRNGEKVDINEVVNR